MVLVSSADYGEAKRLLDELLREVFDEYPNYYEVPARELLAKLLRIDKLLAPATDER